MQITSSSDRRPTTFVALLAIALMAAACGGGVRPTLTGDRLADVATSVPDAVLAPTPTAAPTTAPAGDGSADGTDVAENATPVVEQLTVEVIETFPHDPDAFTQGLELHDGELLESTGLRFESDLRRVVPETGEVTQITPTPADLFAEGLTKVGDELIQLTWQAGRAFYWDATTFELKREVSYTGEGWGLCYNGTNLIMTDGRPELIFRDPATFDELGRVAVTLEGSEVFNLNEIECVGNQVWANLWQTNLIVRIDPGTGTVNAVVDASTLDRPPEADVLNGIAWDAGSQSFYVTGKLWPTMYRVNFVPAAAN